jgi:hypothetical protein
MNNSVVQTVTEASRVFLVTKQGVQEKVLSAHDVVELIRKVLSEGGHVSDRCSSYMLSNGKMHTERKTYIVEKGASI